MADQTGAPANLNGATVTLDLSPRAKIRRSPDKRPKRLHACAIGRIFDRETGELVGWLYEWNTGERVPRWKVEARSDVVYVSNGRN